MSRQDAPIIPTVQVTSARYDRNASVFHHDPNIGQESNDLNLADRHAVPLTQTAPATSSRYDRNESMSRHDPGIGQQSHGLNRVSRQDVPLTQTAPVTSHRQPLRSMENFNFKRPAAPPESPTQAKKGRTDSLPSVNPFNAIMGMVNTFFEQYLTDPK